jgi:hypothetical protein
MELAGITRGSDYDALDVGGTATLDGALEVALFGGFDPVAGSFFDLIRAETIIGQFGALSLPSLASLSWQLDHLIDAEGSTDILRLTAVQTVPVPGAVWLFGSALAWLGWARRRGLRGR